MGALEEALAAIAERAPAMPRAAYANIGAEQADGSWDSSDCPPDAYATAARGWIESGVRCIGGCCGTTPAHIAALRALL